MKNLSLHVTGIWTLTLTAFAAVMVLGASNGAQASLVDADSFDYTANDNLETKNGGTGWGGAWDAPSSISIDNGSLSFTDSNSDNLSVAGNAISFADDGGTANRDTSSSFSNQDIWLSALVRAEDESNQMQVRMRGSGGDNWARFRSKNGDITLFSDNSGSNVDTDDIKGTATVADNTNFLVMKLERGTAAGGDDTLKGWINPDVGVSSPQNFDGSGELNTEGNIGDLQELRLFSGSQTSDGDRFMDEVRFGTSFESVAIPEPGSMTLFLLGAIGLALSRRRNR